MSDFKVTLDLKAALSLTNSKTLRGDLLKAKVNTMIFYLEEIIGNHFLKPSPNKNYKSNKVTYEMWKRKHHPASMFQLVLSGRLREAVFAGRVDDRGRIIFNLPEYGLYQLEAGRDFVSPTAFEQVEMQQKLLYYLFQIRSARAKLSASRR